MTKDNFIRVITLISILLLFFSQSVYDPSVYAKMQKIEDDNLSDVTGEALYLELNATVSGFATSVTVNNNEGDFLQLANVQIGQNAGGAYYPSRIYSSQLADLGSVPGQTWILLGNLEFPYSTGGNTLDACAIINVGGHYPNYGAGSVSFYQGIGNLFIQGFQYGHNVYGVTPWLDCGDPPFIMYSANDDNGLEIRSEFGGYINNVLYRANTSGTQGVSLTGIYVFYGYGNTAYATGDPNGWSSSLTGKLKVGGALPTYNTGGTVANETGRTAMAAINIGTSGTKSIIFMDMPMHGSIRIRNLTMGAYSFGPVSIDDAVFYRNMLEWDLNAFQ